MTTVIGGGIIGNGSDMNTVVSTGTFLGNITTSTSAVTTLTIDWTVNQYVMYSILNSSASDTTFVSYYSINEI